MNWTWPPPSAPQGYRRGCPPAGSRCRPKRSSWERRGIPRPKTWRRFCSGARTMRISRGTAGCAWRTSAIRTTAGRRRSGASSAGAAFIGRVWPDCGEGCRRSRREAGGATGARPATGVYVTTWRWGRGRFLRRTPVSSTACACVSSAWDTTRIKCIVPTAGTYGTTGSIGACWRKRPSGKRNGEKATPPRPLRRITPSLRKRLPRQEERRPRRRRTKRSGMGVPTPPRPLRRARAGVTHIRRMPPPTDPSILPSTIRTPTCGGSMRKPCCSAMTVAFGCMGDVRE
mmetsp:Transcript_4744/g.9337  ORF Transcript_4744/g.9337 Transcript_4744/m.9337 type:complete len:286 (+) Transcript_4744:297-1154(+)